MNNMRLPKLTYFEPKTIDELIEIKNGFREKCAVMAGGTDLIPMLKRRSIATRNVVNIKKIPEFKEISYNKEKGVRIGPAVTLQETIDHPLISNSYSLLAKAASSVAFNQVRSMGTLGGNICLDNKCTYYNQSAFWWKSRPDCFKRGGNMCYVVRGGKNCFALSTADTVPAMIALDTELIIAGPKGYYQTLLEKFYTGDGQKPHQLDENEVVSAILIPTPSKRWKEGFLKKSHRGAMDFSIASLTLRLKMDSQALEDVRIVLNGVSTKPIRAKQAESYLIGKEINHTTIVETIQILLKEATPLSSIGSSAFLRRKMIETMFFHLIGVIKNE